MEFAIRLVKDPVPANADAIRENLALNSVDWVDLHETAVGRAGGSAKMIVSDVSAFSRLETVNVPTGARERIGTKQPGRMDEAVVEEQRLPDRRAVGRSFFGVRARGEGSKGYAEKGAPTENLLAKYQ